MLASVVMARIAWCVAVMVMAASVSATPGNRIRRGYNSGYGDSSSGYGRGSDERDTSGSEESGGCSNGSGGYGGSRGYGYSASQERAYNRDGWKSDTRGGRSLTRSTASAVASASAASYGVNQKTNVVK